MSVALIGLEFRLSGQKFFPPHEGGTPNDCADQETRLINIPRAPAPDLAGW